MTELLRDTPLLPQIFELMDKAIQEGTVTELDLSRLPWETATNEEFALLLCRYPKTTCPIARALGRDGLMEQRRRFGEIMKNMVNIYY